MGDSFSFCCREHSSTIKKRFLSVFIMTIVSPASLYFGMGAHVFEKVFLVLFFSLAIFRGIENDEHYDKQ